MFQTNSERKKHFNNTHRGEIKCPECPKIFLRISDRSRHMKVHVLKPFRCGKCEKNLRGRVIYESMKNQSTKESHTIVRSVHTKQQTKVI